MPVEVLEGRTLLTVTIELPHQFEQMRLELGDESFSAWLASNQQQFGNLQGISESVIDDFDEQAYSQFEQIELTLNQWLEQFNNPCPVNQQPTADPQVLTVFEDVFQEIILTGDNGDPEVIQPLTFIIETLPATGTLILPRAGAITSVDLPIVLDHPGLFFITAPNDVTPQFFDFKVVDSGSLESPTATVTIDVTPVNDRPTADSQTVTTFDDLKLPINLTADDGDPEETQSLIFIIETLPAAGTLIDSGGAPIVAGDLPLTLEDPVVFFINDENDVTPQSFDFKVIDDEPLESLIGTIDIEVAELPPDLEQLRQQLGDEQFAEWLARNKEEIGTLQGIGESVVDEFDDETLQHFEEIESILEQWLEQFNNPCPGDQDNVPPEPVIQGPLGPVNQDPFEVLVDFGEPVVGFELGNVVVTNGEVINFADSGDGFFPLQINPFAPGPVLVDFSAAVAFDLAGNPNLPPAPFEVEFDPRPPQPEFLHGPLGPINLDPFFVDVFFGEPVPGFDPLDPLDLLAANANVLGFIPIDPLLGGFQLQIQPLGGGPLTLDIPAGIATDRANNPNLPALAPFQVDVDAIPPQPEFLHGPLGPINLDPFFVDVFFGEPVPGFDPLDPLDLLAANANVLGFIPIDPLLGGFQLQIQPLGGGPLTLDIPAGIATDWANTPNLPARAPFQTLVTGIGVQNGTLNIVGTAGPDQVIIQHRRAGSYLIRSNTLGSLNVDPALFEGGFDAVHLQLGDGNDRFNALGTFGVPLIVDAGDGNDRLVGSRGGDVLLGGPGNDFIWAGSGNNLVIGGTGRDFLFGGSGQDIVIGGYTSFDSNAPVLRGLLAEWNSDADMAVRVRNLSNFNGTASGSGLNDTKYLRATGSDQSVFDDDDRDLLFGGGNIDWLFFEQSKDIGFGTRRDLLGDDLDDFFDT